MKILLLQKTKIFTVLRRRTKDIKNYLSLKERFESGIDVRTDIAFQEDYKSFYVMRTAGLRSEHFHKYFELLHNRELDLQAILKAMHEIPDLQNRLTLQLSFATKLLHTIDNNLPIYDNFIRRKFYDMVSHADFKVLYRDGFEERINNRVTIYHKLIGAYQMMMQDRRIIEIINTWRVVFKYSKVEISDVKVLDYLIWGLGQIKPSARD